MARLPALRVLIAAGVFRLRPVLAGQRLGRGFAGLAGRRAGRSGRTAGAAGIRDAASESASGGRPSGCICCPGGRRRHCAAGPA